MSNVSTKYVYLDRYLPADPEPRPESARTAPGDSGELDGLLDYETDLETLPEAEFDDFLGEDDGIELSDDGPEPAGQAPEMNAKQFAAALRETLVALRDSDLIGSARRAASAKLRELQKKSQDSGSTVPAALVQELTLLQTEIFSGMPAATDGEPASDLGIETQADVEGDGETGVSAPSGDLGRLAALTNLEPSDVESLLARHGLDAADLPPVPDARVAALLNDAEFSGPLQDLLAQEKQEYQNLDQKIESKTYEANDINRSNAIADTSEVDSIDFTSFKYLYNANYHRDDQSQTLAGTRKEVAKTVAGLLEALYGKPVTAASGEAGTIAFAGRTINVLPGAADRGITFSQNPPEWPSVDLVKIYVDDEGDGMTEVPGWMEEAHYPYYVHDKGGAADPPAGLWYWERESVVDIGREV